MCEKLFEPKLNKKSFVKTVVNIPKPQVIVNATNKSIINSKSKSRFMTDKTEISLAQSEKKRLAQFRETNIPNDHSAELLFEGLKAKIEFVCDVVKFWNYGIDLTIYFKEIDTSNDGMLSLEELQVWFLKHAHVTDPKIKIRVNTLLKLGIEDVTKSSYEEQLN